MLKKSGASASNYDQANLQKIVLNYMFQYLLN